MDNVLGVGVGSSIYRDVAESFRLMGSRLVNGSLGGDMKDVVSGGSLSSVDLTVMFSRSQWKVQRPTGFQWDPRQFPRRTRYTRIGVSFFLMRMGLHLVIDLGESGESKRRLGFVAAL